MTEIRIFCEAVTRALDSGWDVFGLSEKMLFWEIIKMDETYKLVIHATDKAYKYSFNEVIFSIDFAKALFAGDMRILQELVASTNRFAYLEVVMSLLG